MYAGVNERRIVAGLGAEDAVDDVDDDGAPLRVDDDVILHGFCSATGEQTGFEEAEKKYLNRQALHSSTFSYSK